jgi:methionyl-tRNA formyltransferase
MQMERGLDTGPMLASVAVKVDSKTAGALTAELAAKGATLMTEVLANLSAHPPVTQPEDGVTHAPKVDKAEARLDFTAGAAQVERQVRAFNPTPGAFFEHAGERLKLLAVETIQQASEPGLVIDDRLTIGCGDGAIRPLLAQRAARATMTPDELLRGFAIPAGTQL